MNFSKPPKVKMLYLSLIILLSILIFDAIENKAQAGTLVTEITVSYPPFVVAWSPDDAFIAVGEINGTHIYNPDLQELAFFPGDALAALSWSPNSEYFATAGGFYANQGTVQIFRRNFITGNFVLESTIITSHLVSSDVAWSPDGTMIAIVNQDYDESSGSIIYTTEIWHTDGTLKTTLDHQYLNSFSNISWSPNSNRIAGSGTQYKCNEIFCNDDAEGVFVADVNSGERLYFLGVETPTSISWSSQNELAVDGPEFAVYNPETAAQIRVLGPATSQIIWDPSGYWIASALANYIIIQDMFGQFFFSIEAASVLQDMDWRHDGNRIISILENNMIQIWDTAGLRIVPCYATIPCAVSSLTLLNSSGNLIADLLTDNTIIDLATVPTPPWNFRANTTPTIVGSIKFQLDSLTPQVVDIAPYELSWTPTVGSHTLTVTPYSRVGASGAAGMPYTINFTVTQSLSITSFSLIDSVTGLPIAAYDPLVVNTNNEVEIDIDALPNRNLLIRANTNPATVGSVYFSRVYYSPTGQGVPQAIWQETDNSAPYEYSFTSLGWYTLSARAFSGADKTGTAGTPYNLHLNLRDSHQERLNRILFVDGSHIYIMNVDGTNPVDLGAGESPAFSPDGQKIAYHAPMGGSREIFVMNADGTNIVRLTNNAADDRNPSWSPDGSRIVYGSVTSGSDWEIYSMNADGTNKVQLTNNAVDDTDPSWSPNGDLIAFAVLSGSDRQIYSMWTNGSHRIQLTTGTGQRVAPEWPPNGNQIVYNTTGGTNDDVWRINVDGTNGLRLTSNSSSDISPEWSLDGSQIIFSSDRAGGAKRELYLMNADGSGEARFTFTAGLGETAPAWGYP